MSHELEIIRSAMINIAQAHGELKRLASRPIIITDAMLSLERAYAQTHYHYHETKARTRKTNNVIQFQRGKRKK